MHRIPILLVLRLHVSGSFSAHHQEFLAVTSALVHFMQLWWPFATRSRMELQSSSILLLVANGHHNCLTCTKADVTAKNSWWWAERLPETCRVVIPVNPDFSASVGFIHKEICYHAPSYDRKMHAFYINISIQL